MLPKRAPDQCMSVYVLCMSVYTFCLSVYALCMSVYALCMSVYVLCLSVTVSDCPVLSGNTVGFNSEDKQAVGLYVSGTVLTVTHRGMNIEYVVRTHGHEHDSLSEPFNYSVQGEG